MSRARTADHRVRAGDVPGDVFRTRAPAELSGWLVVAPNELNHLEFGTISREYDGGNGTSWTVDFEDDVKMHVFV
jgi:hypothetical protein